MDRGVALSGKRHPLELYGCTYPRVSQVAYCLATGATDVGKRLPHNSGVLFTREQCNGSTSTCPRVPGQPCLVSSLVSGRSPGGRPANLSLSREPHTIWCGFRIRIKLRTEKATQLRKVLIMVGTCSMSAVFGAIAGN